MFTQATTAKPTAAPAITPVAAGETVPVPADIPYKSPYKWIILAHCASWETYVLQCFLFQNKIFFGYFDPENIFIDNENEIFSGWAIRYFG